MDDHHGGVRPTREGEPGDFERCSQRHDADLDRLTQRFVERRGLDAADCGLSTAQRDTRRINAALSLGLSPRTASPGLGSTALETTPAVTCANLGGTWDGSTCQIDGFQHAPERCTEPGGDIIWQIGTRYFGCRNDDGTFAYDMYAEQACEPPIKMIELKISQGAKPGHGGILPAAKVTAEIAAARKVPQGQDCFSPPGHSAFSTPIELLEFIQQLREGSGGKPVGFKICIGAPHEFFAICKAMMSTGIKPDFITVDGAEGGTGAAPIEFSDHLGTPLREGLLVAHNALVGLGIRDELKLAASGKRVSSYELATAMALGANWCNVARGFMFSLGCIQSQSCHTNKCPVGVATQDLRLQRGLVVEDKAQRVRNFHANTVQGLAEMTAACGLDHPNEFRPDQIFERLEPNLVQPLSQVYKFLQPGQLLEGSAGALQHAWDTSNEASFAPS